MSEAEELTLDKLGLLTEYRTGEHDLVNEFYSRCLDSSISYDRAVGFFRSTILLLVGRAVIQFAKRNGRMRVVCSPVMTEQDVNALSEGYEQRHQLAGQMIAAEIEKLLCDAEMKSQATLLATLVKVGTLELKVALRPTQHGLYHEKIGLFSDTKNNIVSFKGSSNETWSAWHPTGNFESIEVFCSWGEGVEAERVTRHRDYFQRLWDGVVPDVEVFDLPVVAREKLYEAAAPSLDAVGQDVLKTPAKPRRTPHPHQKDALNSWKAQGSRGILEHATGSGKTFIALMAMSEYVAQGLPALVLVPSLLLQSQWEAEIREEIPEASLLLAGGDHNKWRLPDRLRSLSCARASSEPRIILSTIQTATTEEFLRKVAGGDHLMVVADEVHQTGSRHHSRIFSILSGPRLGLSATPRRYGDPEGTRRLLEYFGPIVEPPFTLKDAIGCGRLVEYEYFPHALRLTADEAQRWREVTIDIVREYAKHARSHESGSPPSERLQLLLIQRARIAKKAASKITCALSVVKKHYEQGQRWLVYCDDQEQLVEVRRALREHSIDSYEYHSSMLGDRSGTLDWFRRYGGIMVSIRCLDEGIDIPEITHGLILASSQNPRQFIQRRGRVLRKAPEKYKAVVHDALVIPSSLEAEPDQVSLAKSELARALEFAGTAMNRYAAAEVRDIAARIGLDPASLVDVGLEDEEGVRSYE